jgi:hypothetical protein
MADTRSTRGDLKPVNSKRLGWQPVWDEEKFLASLDDEVEAVINSDEAATTAFDGLTTR